MRRLLLILVVFAVWFLNVAASSESQANAIMIMSGLGLVLPFLYKLIPAAGHYMVLITVVVSVLAAVVAMLMSGELNFSALQHTNATQLYLTVLGVYGLSQFVYSLATQSPTTAKAVE